jgi:misacylated tRNA(Ala) deacylase
MSKDYDPRMHSAEHIFNQTMVRKFNCGRSFSMHLEKKKSKCDFHFDRDLTQDEIREIESRVNQVIQSDEPVHEDVLTKEEAEKLYNLARLPDQNEETIRIVRIGDYDACPCIGGHVARTKEIGQFRIISTSYENGVLRVRFKLSEEQIGAKSSVPDLPQNTLM